MKDGLVQGEVPREYLQEIVKKSCGSVAVEATALHLANYAEAAGLSVEFYIDNHDSPGEVELYIRELGYSFIVAPTHSGGRSRAYVIDGIGGREHLDPYDTNYWRATLWRAK